MKFITIDSKNQTRIANQYNVDAEDVAELLPLGYILLADFSEEMQPYEGVVTKAHFATLYNVGAELKNGYFEALPKG